MKQKKSRKQKEIPLIYVVPVQRLDQNTSGLFVVGTEKKFAAYFAKLLRDKTDAQLEGNVGSNHMSNNITNDSHVTTPERSKIYKKYRCLVCMNTEGAEKLSAFSNNVIRLRKLSNDKTMIQHYLEPSPRAPKTFSIQKPSSTWLECLLRLTNVGEVLPVVDSAASLRLSKALWGDNGKKPKRCVGVVEIELELLTGRTHQIRGQLSQMGFPLCGDAMYGGVNLSTPSVLTSTSQPEGYEDSDRLALQCCELKFPDPDYVNTGGTKNKIVAIESERWNRFRLDEAWWSSHLDCYKCDANDNTSNVDGIASSNKGITLR